MSVVHTRLDETYIKTLDQLATAKGSNRSEQIREAVKMYLAEYTGEPNLKNVQKQLRDVESRLNQVEGQVCSWLASHLEERLIAVEARVTRL